MRRIVLIMILAFAGAVAWGQEPECSYQQWISFDYEEQYQICVAYVSGLVVGLANAKYMGRVGTEPHDSIENFEANVRLIFASRKWKDGVVKAVNEYYREEINRDSPATFAVNFFTLSLYPKRLESGQ